MTAKGEYHNINKLYGAPPGGSGGQAKSLRTSIGVGRYGVINGVVVYDHWYTTLSADDSFWIGGAGGSVANYIDVLSFGEDAFDLLYDMEYTIYPETIPENLDDYEKTHYITITQIDTGIQITVVCTLGPVEWTYDYSLDMSPTTVSASGGYSYATVYRWVYRNGKYYSYSTITPTALDGYTVNGSGHFLGSSYVYINSAGTDWYEYTRTVYAVTSYTFKYGGYTYTNDTYVSIAQSPNTRTTTSVYSVDMDSPSVSSLSASGGTFTVKGYCKTATAYVYASGASLITGDWTGSLANVFYDGSVTSVSPSLFTNEATITVVVPENTSTSSRDVTIRVRSSYDSDLYVEKTVTQAGKVSVVLNIRAEKYKETDANGIEQKKISVSVYVISNGGPTTFTNNYVQIRYANSDFDDAMLDGETSTKIDDISITNDGSSNLVYSNVFTINDDDVYNDCKVWASIQSAAYKTWVSPLQSAD